MSELERLRIELGEVTGQLEIAESELERVKRQNASMASCLSHIKQLALECREDPKIILSAVGLSACGGLDPDAGRDYIAKESVRPLVEALRAVNDWDDNPGDPTTKQMLAEVRSALSHARQLGLLEDTK